MALPVVVLVLALCLNALAVLAVRVELIDQSAQAARLIGRGETIGEVQRLLGTAEFSVDRPERLVCVRLERQLGAIPIAARACALDAGQ